MRPAACSCRPASRCRSDPVRGGVLLLASLAATASPAAADPALRKLCTDRPGLGTPACTLDAGHVQLEIGLADWTLDRQAGARSDDVDVGDTLVRIGIADHAELQVGWTFYGWTRERAGGAVSHDSGTGDLFIAFRRNLLRPDGAGTTVALMPYATLPTGGRALGAGTWSAGVEVPFGFDLSDAVSLEFAPRAEAAADADRHGRHLAYGSVAGVAVDLSPVWNMTAELAATRDDDPSGHSTQELAGLSFGWTPGRNFQLDAGANVGLHAAPDLEVYAGIVRRF
jgi:hypothetical protein